MTGLLAYLAETAAALAVFYGLHRAVLARDTHLGLTRLYLLGSLVVAHLVPLVDIPSPFRRAVVQAAHLGVFEPELAAAVGWTWMDVLVWVYVAGALVTLLRLGWYLRHLALIVRRHPMVRQAGLRVVYVDEDCPPFSFFRTAFVHRPTGGDTEMLDQVIAHERTHIAQAHWLDILLVQLAAVGQWFNPFIWFYRRAVKELHEFLADREVLAQGFVPSTYTQLLLEHHLGARSLEFAHHLRQSQIRRRLDMMSRRSGQWSVCKYLLALPALALLVVVYAEPRIAAADGSSAIGPPAPAVFDQGSGPATQADVKKAKEEDAKAADRKAAEVEFKKKMAVLKDEYVATSDSERKKEIAAKMAALEKKYAELMGNGNAPDAAAIEDMIAKLSQKIEVLKAKSLETTDPVVKEKIKEDMDKLLKKRKELKVQLAELQAGKQK